MARMRRRSKTGSESAAEKSINGLPSELLELIMSKLTLKWNVHASLVCKRWQEAALSVRVVTLPDVLDVMSSVTRKINLLDNKVVLLSAQVDSLATAVAESHKNWGAFEEYGKELDGSSSDPPNQLSTILLRRTTRARTKREVYEGR